MELEALNKTQLKALYGTALARDFPPEELRPFFSMEDLLDRGAYLCYAAAENGGRLGYALLARQAGAVLLDYFAVEPEHRGRGVGTAFLAALRRLPLGADFLLIEAESPESAEEDADRAQRERRLRFYRHCGCQVTPVCAFLFGVEYRILALPLGGAAPPEAESVQEALEGLYRLIVPRVAGQGEAAYRRVCRVFTRPEEPQSPPAFEPAGFARELGLSITFLTRDRGRFMGERLKGLGFSGAMYNIVLFVGRNPGCTQDSIANRMYIDKSNVARRIKQLEALGVLRRETDPEDRRQNNLYLTESGAALVPVIRGYLEEWGRQIAADLSQEERTALLALLSRMLRR